VEHRVGGKIAKLTGNGSSFERFVSHQATRLIANRNIHLSVLSGEPANKMLQYLAAVSAAAITDAALFFVQLDDDNTLVSAFRLPKFGTWRLRLGEFLYRHRRVIFQRRLAYEEFALLSGESKENLLLLKGYQRQPPIQHDGINPQRIFSLNSDYQERVDTLIKTFAVAPSEACAIHIHRQRGGDELTNRIGADYYQEALANIPTDLPVVVFTNDNEWAKEVLDNKPIHCFVTDNEPIVELFAMAGFRHLILSNTSTDWWAGRLNTTSGRRIYVPRIYSTGGEESNLSTDNCEADWIVIPNQDSAHCSQRLTLETSSSSN
jgi:hypothetical protein